MMDHCRKLFITFIWVIMAPFSRWIRLVDKGMAKIGDYRANAGNNEHKEVYKHKRRMGRVEEKYIQRESERERCQTTQVVSGRTLCSVL